MQIRVSPGWLSPLVNAQNAFPLGQITRIGRQFAITALIDSLAAVRLPLLLPLGSHIAVEVYAVSVAVSASAALAPSPVHLCGYHYGQLSAFVLISRFGRLMIIAVEKQDKISPQHFPGRASSAARVSSQP